MTTGKLTDRFSLLLLEENEVFTKDYGVDYIPPAENELESVSL